MDFIPVETFSPPASDIELLATAPAAMPATPQSKASKQDLRNSLRASTLDGMFAAFFSSVASGVLITNFLLQLGANAVEIGLLSSIPMLLNLLQPLGAYFADRTNSRHNYCLWIFGPSRLLWLILVIGIGWVSWSDTEPQRLVTWTLAIILLSNILAALGSASWVSWMAALVPHKLRGRYFGLRNSASSLTTLLSVPLLGFAVSAWPSGPIQGYGIVLFLGILAGIVSLVFQFFIVDVNPQATHFASPASQSVSAPNTDLSSSPGQLQQDSILKDTNFLMFLLYFGTWMFAVNISSPFFNLYLLDNLKLDLSWATVYTSLVSGANLVMLVFWGKLADRLGNRPLLLLVGILVAVSPLFWLGVGTDQLSVWLWLPLIHLFNGTSGAAIDLCNSNIQMEVVPANRPSKYFAIAAAVAGVSGGLGTTVGGFLAQLDGLGGLPGLFALSAVVRLVALLPLVFVREPRSQPVVQVIRNLFKKLTVGGQTSVSEGV